MTDQPAAAKVEYGVTPTQVMASMANPPQTVSTTTAGLQDWQPQVEAVGSLRAVNGADLSLELAGIVEQINFNSGDDVEAVADVLVRTPPVLGSGLALLKLATV